uniref:Innexin n=1 Tax=Globodera pallida TaxID=36090 RepID=A0A183C3L0_GLOPA
MALPMVGGVYLGHLWRGTTGKLRALARPLLKDGIGDRMDKGNLWVVPGFTLLVFAILWTTKLSKIALEESTCRGASIYDFGGTQLDDDAKRHCQTAKRYYVGPDEAFSHDHNWRKQREVKNPEWILWFWAPIVFVMYVLTRFMWTLLLENQGINFANVVGASQSITVEHDGITEIDEEKLADRLPVIVENFRCSYSSRAYAAFLAFECSLFVAPLLLLLFVLPLMIGGAYRTWGLDIARAWWERRDWQGSPLLPFYDASVSHDVTHEVSQRRPVVPLIPRITYCDYHFVSLGNSHTLTYRCYMDANWHERTALFTWVMLTFLASINLGNLVFWFEWTVRMRFRHQRRGWVIKKWLNADGFNEAELALMMRFAESFKMGQLLYFYYIEAHTDRVVASAFCTALFARWLEKRQRRKSAALAIGMPPDDDSAAPTRGSISGTAALNAYGAAAMPLMSNEVVGSLPDAPTHYHTVSTPYRSPPGCTLPYYQHPAAQHVQQQRQKPTSKYFVVQTEPFGPTRIVKRKDEEEAVLDATTPERRKSRKRWSIRDLMKRMSTNYGWNIGMEMPPLRPIPTAPYPTPPNAASFSDASTALMRGSRSHSIIHSPRSPPGDVVPPELALGTPSTSALVGRRKARSPNLAAEIGRDSLCQGPEEEQRRAERRRQADERRRTEQEEAQKTKQQQKKDKSSSSSISSDSSGEDEDGGSRGEGGGGVVTERAPKISKKRSAIVTERTPLVEEEQRQQQQQQQDETAKRKQSKEKSPPGKGNGGGGASSTARNTTPPGRNRPTPPGGRGAGNGKQQQPLQRQDEEAEEE